MKRVAGHRKVYYNLFTRWYSLTASLKIEDVKIDCISVIEISLYIIEFALFAF